MRESVLYDKLKGKVVRCKTCSHGCIISDGKRGICGVRENISGKLFFLPFGRAIAANVDPVEKKPLFHFLPGTLTFSISTVGCNLRCGNCQNWNISQFGKFGKVSREAIEASGEKLEPREVIRHAKANGCPSISYTYTEPTIFLEYALEAMKIAKQEGLKNIWVSNGFMSKKCLELVAPYLDAINIDIKSFDDNFYRKHCGARLAPVLENCKIVVRKNIWLETTTLIIPELSDSEIMLKNIARFQKEELGDFVPWHVSAFSGPISWKLGHLPETPVRKIKKAYEIGKNAGLKYVYAGNVPGIDLESTYCSKCRQRMIERKGYNILRLDEEGKCRKCKTGLDIIN